MCGFSEKRHKPSSEVQRKIKKGLKLHKSQQKTKFCKREPYCV